MRTITIHSWDALQEAVFGDVWDEKTLRYRANFIYRGSADEKWTLTPSLNRVFGHDLKLESAAIRSFKKYGYADLAGCSSFWQIIAMAQHFGLPTRLLDWTYSPLVAAHFATVDVDKYDRDGAIWCVDIHDVNARQLPEPLKAQLTSIDSSCFTADMLERNFHDFSDMPKVSGAPYALFFEPSSMVNRIANQYSLFSLTSDPNTLVSDILIQNDCACKKIILSHEVKLEIRDKLDYINISERMLYPGLDGICKWITRHYSALGPVYNRGRGEDTDVN